MAKNTTVGTALLASGGAGMLAVWLASVQNEACLYSPAYLIPFAISAAAAVVGLRLILARGSTRYDRLKVIYKEGERLRKRFERSKRASDPVMEIARKMNESSKWTIKVDEELEKIAPEHLSEWQKKLGPFEQQSDAKMAARLSVLDGILERIRAKDSGS